MSRLRIIVAFVLGAVLVSGLSVAVVKASDIDFGYNDIKNVVNYIGARYSAVAQGAPGLIGYRYRGSVDSPEVVQKDDQVFRMRAYGYDGAALQIVGELAFEIDGTPGMGKMPGRYVIRLTGTDPNILVEAMRLDQNIDAPAPGGFDAYFGRDIVAERYSNIPNSSANFIGHKYRGTKTAPLAVQNGDVLAAFRSYGYDGTKLTEAADIRIEVDGTPGKDDMPTSISFWVTPDGASHFVKAMKINNDRSVTIPELASDSGLWFVCVDTAGKLSSQATACGDP